MEGWRKKDVKSKKDSLSWKTVNDVDKIQHKCKDDRNNFVDKNSDSLSIKMQSLSPYLLDKNWDSSKRKIPLLELKYPLSSLCLVINVFLRFIDASTLLGKL